MYRLLNLAACVVVVVLGWVSPIEEPVPQPLPEMQQIYIGGEAEPVPLSPSTTVAPVTNLSRTTWKI